MKKHFFFYARLLGSLLIPALTLIILLKQPTHPPWEVPEDPPINLTVETVQEVRDYYESIGYTLNSLQTSMTEVPRIYLDSIVNTWAKSETVASKKSLFYRTMLPLVLRTNEIIEAQRKHLLTLAADFHNGEELNSDDFDWLKDLASYYKVVKNGQEVSLSENFFHKLTLRVDCIPVSMALGQMAYESGYATSRFAGEGNALFGQWRWDKGMKPEKQREGKGDYRVADFKSPIDSIEAYARNMNTNRAYQEFRQERSKQRAEGRKYLDGMRLSATLHRYSEERHRYVSILQGIIKNNHLSQFDGAGLADCTPVILIPDLGDS
ncbi:MAG: glucosaminidase domain-containing protein [Desulfobulbaceae bacterium]|nr:glucosaminidase domain-containing protein [Desulfobulbaceae bacterium]